MKTLNIISMSILMLMFVTTSNARESKSSALNTTVSNAREAKMEKREFRREERNEVSNMSKDAFLTDFGKIPDVVWKRNDQFDVASFVKNGKHYEAFYDNTSTLVGTVTLKTFADLPQKAQQEIKKQFKNYAIDKVIFYKDNEGNDYNFSLYGVQFDNNDHYFVEMSKNKQNAVLEVDPDGYVSFFRELNET